MDLHRAGHGIGRRALSAARVAASIGLLCASVAAEPHSAIDLEPLSPYWGARGQTRVQVWVVSYVYGNLSQGFFPFFGGGIGFFTLQTRGGVAWMPGDLEEPGPIVRLDVRPQVRFGRCWEPMVLGGLGAGYRWPLERGDPGYPGTALYVMPAFTGGEAFLHDNCGTPEEQPLRGTVLYSGTLSGGFDW